MKLSNREGIKVSQIRALVAVAEHENFTEAALHLNVSQSAISHAIASLEEELGVVLVSRGRHGARLTAIGEQILIDAQHIMSSLEEINRKANSSKGLQSGQVRLAVFRSVATHILPPVIAQFRQIYPKITVSITEHHNLQDVEQKLRQGQADIGFTYLPTSEEFEAWEIFRDQYVVLLPPSANIRSNTITWEELQQYPLILPPINDGCRMLLNKRMTELKQPLNVAYEVREDSTIVSMVEQGLGAAIIARLAAEPVPSKIHRCDPPVPIERIIGVAILSNALHTPAVFAFLDALRGTGKFRRPTQSGA